uniref:Uncharacterized protein n=1 Tax=Romanomermis culicivorax TaxID=13658 RepID=A0A915IF95_ROMCU
MCSNQPRPQDDLDGDGRWMSIHERFKSEVKSNEPDVIFFGDSHIALLEQSDFYQEAFAPLHCLCFGIRGDTTDNVMWRILDGELEYVKPKFLKGK